MIARGIRNNNPLNIRLSKDRWQGQKTPSPVGEGRGETTFCQFETMEWGWRAAFRLLTRTYYRKYGLETISAIISRWAPANENDTVTYIRNVCALTGLKPDEPLGAPDEHPARWLLLGAAMALQECGSGGLTPFAMLRGWEMM